ncbi:MAG: SDR family NAD(P)-dependent oxidoreductase [bacterium]
MRSYKNKTVLVTGASSGIGAAFARLLAAEGANLVLTARSEGKLQELADALVREHGVAVQVMPGDLGHTQTPRKLFEQTQKAGLEIDVVINNAGFGKWGKFESVDYETYQDMCQLNIHAVVALTHLFLPGLLEKGDGGFINVASTAAFQPVPFFATYSATKSFVLNFSEALWAECKDRGVTVTCLCPGGTQSNFHQVSKIDPDKLVGLESPDKVAKLGLQAFLKGEMTVISGLKNYLLANSSRFVTRRLVTQVTASMFKPTN